MTFNALNRKAVVVMKIKTAVLNRNNARQKIVKVRTVMRVKQMEIRMKSKISTFISSRKKKQLYLNSQSNQLSY
jgi:hypothetical protein